MIALSSLVLLNGSSFGIPCPWVLEEEAEHEIPGLKLSDFLNEEEDRIELLALESVVSRRNEDEAGENASVPPIIFLSLAFSLACCVGIGLDWFKISVCVNKY